MNEKDILKQQIEQKDKEIEKWKNIAKLWSEECERKFMLLADNTHRICEKIREHYNLRKKQIVKTINGDYLKEFLDELEEEDGYERMHKKKV